MSNEYNVVVPSGKEYPSQAFVDNFLNQIDAVPTCSDLDKLKDMAKEEAKAYIAEKMEEIQNKIEGYFADISASLQSKMTPLKPLISPPTSLDDVVNYCKTWRNISQSRITRWWKWGNSIPRSRRQRDRL